MPLKPHSPAVTKKHLEPPRTGARCVKLRLGRKSLPFHEDVATRKLLYQVVTDSKAKHRPKQYAAQECELCGQGGSDGY